MTQEWRATGGRSGLPVVDFGHVLRVPRHALEQLIGAPLTGSAARSLVGVCGHRVRTRVITRAL